MAKQPNPTTPPPGNGAALKVFEQANAVFAKVTGSLQSVASMGGQPTAAIASFTSQVGKVASLFGPWGQVAGAFVQVAGQIPQVLKSAADSIKNYVQAFSPLTAQRYDRAWADLTAAIGRTLMPVLEGATAVVRYFGDTLAGLQPVLGPLVRELADSLKPVFRDAGVLFRELIANVVLSFQAFAPLRTVLFQLINPVNLLVVSMRPMIAMFTQLNQIIGKLFGLKNPNFEGASQGLSYVGTQTTSPAAMLQAIRERAFALGGERKAGPAEQQVDLLKMLVDGLQNLPKKFADALGGVIGTELGKLFPPAFQQAITNMSKAATGLNNFFGGGGVGGGGGGGGPRPGGGGGGWPGWNPFNLPIPNIPFGG